MEENKEKRLVDSKCDNPEEDDLGIRQGGTKLLYAARGYVRLPEVDFLQALDFCQGGESAVSDLCVEQVEIP